MQNLDLLIEMTTTQNLIVLTIITSIFFCLMWVRCHYNLSRKRREFNSLSEEYNNLQIKDAILEQRFADSKILNEQKTKEITEYHQIISTLEKEVSSLKASYHAKEENLQEKITYLEKIKEDLTLKFKSISSEVIRAQQETFTLTQKNTLSAVINPFAEQLKSFKAEVTAAREESIKTKSHMDAQLSQLASLNINLSKEAENLTEALKGGKKLQGNWGECQLNRILEISGLRKDIDYTTQETIIDDNKKALRPDIIVHLPEQRDIIIDSKVSLVDYLTAVNTENEKEQEDALQKNLLAIKTHIDELSTKEYQKIMKHNSLNYVIMFIPIESAYIAALEKDYNLYDYAYKKNIIIATPLSLLPTLRTVENIWKVDKQNQNVQKIAEIGGKIYDKLAAFAEDMKVLDRGLNQANQAYSHAMIKLTGRGGAISQAEKMKQLGAKTEKNINLALNDNDLLLEYQTEDTLVEERAEKIGE